MLERIEKLTELAKANGGVVMLEPHEAEVLTRAARDLERLVMLKDELRQTDPNGYGMLKPIAWRAARESVAALKGNGGGGMP